MCGRAPSPPEGLSFVNHQGCHTLLFPPLCQAWGGNRAGRLPSTRCKPRMKSAHEWSRPAATFREKID